VRSVKSLCANHAFVTIDSFSFNCPKYCGLSHIATTAFCFVDRVTSAGRFMRALESIWRVHATPNREDALRVSVFFSRSVKYEKSSVALSAC
jgi:hypothetical protein